MPPKPSHKQDTNASIKITVHGHTAWVDLKFAEQLIPLLTIPFQRFAQAADGSLQPVRCIQKLYRRTRKRFTFPAGLALRVECRLSEQNYVVRVDLTNWTVLNEVNVDYAKLKGEPLIVAHMVQGRPSRQFHISSENAAFDVVVQILELLAHGNCIVVVRNKREVKSTIRRLKKALKRPVSAGGDDLWQHRPMTLVCTPKLFGVIPDLDFDVVVFVDAELALADKVYRGFRHIPQMLRYAIVDPTRPLHENDQLRLEAIFGPAISPARLTNCPVAEFHFVPPPATPAQRERLAVDRKRKCIWENDDRNQLATEIADALVGQKFKTLKHLGVPLRPEARTRLRKLKRELRVAILVENTKHANELLERLPNWSICTTKEAMATTRLAIVTAPVAEAGGLDAHVVIRADGTADDYLKQFLEHEDSVERVIIDFADQFDRQARKETERRQAQYEI